MLQIIINYHMSVLGQLEGLSGHLSPLGGYCRAEDRVLLMDVWWETRPCWVLLQDIWTAMDTVDPASNEKVGLDRLGCTLLYSIVGYFQRGFVSVSSKKKSDD